MTTTKSLVTLGHEWLNAKIDILKNTRSGRVFLITRQEEQHVIFIRALTQRSEEAYRLFNCTYDEMNDLILDYKICRDNVINGTNNPWGQMQRWNLVYPHAFAGLYEITAVDMLDSIEEVLTNILSAVMRPRRSILL